MGGSGSDDLQLDLLTGELSVVEVLVSKLIPLNVDERLIRLPNVHMGQVEQLVLLATRDKTDWAMTEQVVNDLKDLKSACLVVAVPCVTAAVG